MKNTLRLLILGLALSIFCAGNLALGSTDLTSLPPDTAHYILLHLRLPEALMALVAGVSLALAGLVMQTVMGNPLADPSILGVSSGASLGTALVLLALGSPLLMFGGQTMSGFLLTVGAALIGALAVTALLVAFSSRVANRVTLLLVGVMLSFVVSSVVSVLSHIASADSLRQYALWGLGTFGGVQMRFIAVAALVVLPVVVGLHWFWRPLNALLLGETHAAMVGHNVRVIRSVLLLISGVLTAVVTALCGPIAFVGLAAPHAARMLFRTADHRVLIPATALLGGTTLLLCNLLCHLPAQFLQVGILPVNAITPLIGAPVVIWYLMKR